MSKPKAGSADVLAALRALDQRGHVRIRASMLAEVLWPDGRDHNSQGQTFPLSAGAAGRLLRRCHAVHEIEPRLWEIIRERLS